MSAVKDGVVRRGSTWSYVIRVTNQATGVSRPKWVGGFSTEAAAKAARDRARVAARRGEYVDQSRTSVEAYLEEWLAGHAASVKPKTWAGYRDDLRRYVMSHIGRMRLQAVKPATLSRLYVDLLKSGGRKGKPLAVATVRHVHRFLRKALNDAVLIDGILASNPALLAKLPKETRRVTRNMWTAQDLDVFLEAISGHRLHAFYRVAAFTGARRGEVLHLRWSDLDLEEDIIRFEGSTGVVDGERIDGTTKGWPEPSRRNRPRDTTGPREAPTRSGHRPRARWSGVARLRFGVHVPAGSSSVPGHADPADAEAHRGTQQPDDTGQA